MAHVPDLAQGRGWLVGLLAFLVFGVASALMMLVDHLLPAWTGVGQVLLIALGFVWMGQFFWRRAEYTRRWGAMAYRNAFARHVLIGLPTILAAVFHTGYVPGVRIVAAPYTLWLNLLALYLFITGVTLWLRAAFACGLDTLAMLYVYFPQEGHLVESSIYRILRHPIYSAVSRVVLALGLWRGTWFSMAFALCVPVGLTLWLRFAEERELVERMGDEYRDYQRSRPAFWPRLRDVPAFWRFLATGR